MCVDIITYDMSNKTDFDAKYRKIFTKITKVSNVVKVKVFFSLLLFSIFVLLGCSQQDAKDKSQNEERATVDIEITEKYKVFDEIKLKYNAVDFDFKYDWFSVDIVDTYKGKNLFAEIRTIYDVFYIGDDMYMNVYMSHFYEEVILLKITPEQYSKIKTLDYKDYGVGKFNSPTCVIFTLDNIEKEFSTLDAWFDFSIGDKSLDNFDYDLSDSYHTRILKGTLIDIVETEE